MTHEVCPLCAAEASATVGPYGERRFYRCGNCGEFLISPTAEKRLNDFPERRARLAEQVKATPVGKRLEITWDMEPGQTGHTHLAVFIDAG